MYKIISSSLTEKVRDSCDGTYIGNVTSAIDVFRYYCSAAKDLVVATVSDSTTHAQPTASSTYSSKAIYRATGSAGATATSSTSADAAKELGSSDEDTKQDSSDNNIMPIAGGVAGAVILTALGIGFFFIFRRERRRRTRGERLSDDTDDPPEYSGHIGNIVSIKGHKAPPVVSELSSAVLPKSRFDGGNGFVGLSINHAPTAELQAHLAKMNPPPRYSRRPGVGTQSEAVDSYEMGSSFRIW
jgi:hypothetical protein